MTEIMLRRAADADSPAVRALIYDVLGEYGLRPDPGGTDADLAGIEANYWARGGRFWVLAGPDGQVLGSCALHPVDRATVELRKMYLRPDLRGQGWGRRLLDHALAAARTDGYRRVQLETAGVLTEAIALYARYGFRRTTCAPDASRCDQVWVLELEADR